MRSGWRRRDEEDPTHPREVYRLPEIPVPGPWTIRHGARSGHTVPKDRLLVAPLGDSPFARAPRAHEMAHVRFSPELVRPRRLRVRADAPLAVDLSAPAGMHGRSWDVTSQREALAAEQAGSRAHLAAMAAGRAPLSWIVQPGLAATVDEAGRFRAFLGDTVVFPLVAAAVERLACLRTASARGWAGCGPSRWWPRRSSLLYEPRGSLAASFELLARLGGAEARLFPGYARLEVSLDERVCRERKALRGALEREKLRTLEAVLRDGEAALAATAGGTAPSVAAPAAGAPALSVAVEAALLDSDHLAAVKLALETKRLPLTPDDLRLQGGRDPAAARALRDRLLGHPAGRVLHPLARGRRVHARDARDGRTSADGAAGLGGRVG